MASRYRAWSGAGNRLVAYQGGMRLTSTHGEPTQPVEPPPGEPEGDAIIVSLTGNDTTGAGTLANPYRSFSKAAAVVTAGGVGGTIYLRGGYYDVVDVDVYVGGTAFITLTGTALNPILVSSYPGEWAIFDGINHIWHPRYENDGNSISSPYVLCVRTEYTTMEYFEVRNSVGRNIVQYGIHSTFRHIVSRNAHNTNFFAAGFTCVYEDLVLVDGYSVSNGGNSANGFGILPGRTWENEFPAYGCEDNIVRRVLAHNNSDDGLTCSFSRYDNVYEHNLSMYNGDGPTGNGMGFKMGLGQPEYLSRNIFRYNIAYHNKANAYDTNGSQGVLCHNNLTIGTGVTGFVLTQHSAGACENTARNNLSVSNGTYARIIGQDGCSGNPTTHTNNAGAPVGWGDSTYGANNLTFTLEELALVSTDPTSADFGKLSAGSLAIGAGITVNQASDQDLGPVPYGSSFANGWNWRILLERHPSVRRSYYSEPGGVPTQYPMPQSVVSEPITSGPIYVSLTGSDSTGDGSIDNPYRTLHIPCDPTDSRCAKPGDTIYIRGGVYDTINTDVYYSWYGVSSIGSLGTVRRVAGSSDAIEWGGTSGNPITIKSYPGETAIFDGKNHSHHPRSFGDGLDNEGPYMLGFLGHWLVIEDIEVRWGVGKGVLVTGDNNIIRNVRSYKHHSDGFFGDGSYNLFESCVAHDNNGVASGGNNGDGFKRGTGFTYSETYGTAAAGTTDAMTDNVWRYCLAYDNSDDGYDIGFAKNSLIESSLALGNGIGPSGNGVGFKLSLGDQPTAATTARYCIAYDNAIGFDTNGGQQCVVHNCTSVAARSTGFTFTQNTYDACDNTAHNNLSVDSALNVRIVGHTDCSGDPTTHTHNAGSTAEWADHTYGSSNYGWSAAELEMVSKDPTVTGFATLGSASLARGAGTLVTGGESTDTDLGAIPFGGTYWDWQAEVYDPEA